GEEWIERKTRPYRAATAWVRWHDTLRPARYNENVVHLSEEIAMKIHEYQAKELLAAAGASVPRGVIAKSPAAAQLAFDKLGGAPVVLKAQVHAGGRGKGRFKDSGKDFGGVKYLRSREEVGSVAEVMLKFPLVTKQ